ARHGASVWSVATGQKVRDLDGSDQNPANGCFSPDGTQVAYLAGRVICVGPVDGSRPLREIRADAPDEPRAVFWPRADRLVALWYNRLAALDPATGRPRHPDLDRYPAEPAGQLHVSADGRRLLTAGGRSAQTWDLPAGRLLAPIGDHTRPFGTPRVALSPDGRRVAGERLTVRGAETGAEV